MLAYYIANYTVHDAEKHTRYLEAVLEAAVEAGGNVITAGDELTVLEGEPGNHLLIIAFPTINEAQHFYVSSPYQSIITMRHESTNGWAIVAQSSATATSSRPHRHSDIVTAISATATLPQQATELYWKSSVNAKNMMLQRPPIPTVLPPPFEWVYVPSHTPEAPRDDGYASFYVSKYAITIAQYTVFVQHTRGTRRAKWWNFAARATYWRSASHANAGLPYGQTLRALVALQDAQAFCKWLGLSVQTPIVTPTCVQLAGLVRDTVKRAVVWQHATTHLDSANLDALIPTRTPAATELERDFSRIRVAQSLAQAWEWCTDTPTPSEASPRNSLASVPHCNSPTLGFRVVAVQHATKGRSKDGFPKAE